VEMLCVLLGCSIDAWLCSGAAWLLGTPSCCCGAWLLGNMSIVLGTGVAMRLTVQRLLLAQEYCPSGHRCSNQMFTKREYGKIEVVRAWMFMFDMFLGCTVVLSAC